ncbi:MAG: DUF2393 family protein [Helicobacteraceae bacterium]|nr:DUF2393 family protein [Helicobacteraceae bacterium]
MLEQLAETLDKLSSNPTIIRLIALSDELLYSLTPYHLAVFGAVFAALILCLIISASLSGRPSLSLIFQMCALGILVVGPVAGYFWVERRYKPFAIENPTILNLYYQEKAIVFGEALNTGDKPLDECRVKIIAYEPPNGTLDYLRKLARPTATGEIKLKNAIYPDERRKFEIELDGVKYDQNLTLSINIRCR